MSTSERIVLDPAEITLGTRSELDITPWIDVEGIDWGEASIEAMMADKDRGSVPVDYRIPNREVSVPLALVSRGGTTGVQIRASIQAKIALFQKEGGWIKRLTNSGGTVFADIVDAAFTATSVPGYASKQDIDLEAHAALTLLPDWYGAEQTLADHTETTQPDITFTETSIDGDYPARVRIVVDEDDGENQRGLLGCFRSRYYSASNLAAMSYQAESLEALGGAAAKATTGASGGTAVGGTLWPTFTQILGTRRGGTAHLTHQGTNRIWARCWLRGTVGAQVRLKYDVNDLVNPVVNDYASIPSPGAGTTAGSAFYMVDLGEARLDPTPVGTHRWQGQLEARTTAGTARFRVDKFYVLNVDEGYWKLQAPMTAGATNQTLQAYDDFSGKVVGGTLSAGAALKGGNWDEAGDTTDFLYTAASGTVSTYAVRSALSDADLNTGQYLVLDGSSTLAGIEAQVDVALPIVLDASKEIRGGVVARYVDTNNWLMAVRRHRRVTGDTLVISLLKRVAGVVTTLGEISSLGMNTGFYTIKVTADTAGNAKVYTGLAGSDLGAAVISVTADTSLATGGALDDGKVGIYDATSATSGTYQRLYDNFQAFTGETPDSAVIFASQSMQSTTDGHFRLDAGGTAYGPVAVQNGDLPRLPVAGLEGRTTEVFIKASRGDFDQLKDSGIDDLSVRCFYRPSWLHVDDT